MAKIKYTTDNIKQHLQSLGFNWLDKLVFDSGLNKYRKFNRNDFKKDLIALYLQNPFEERFKALCEISDTKFILKVGKQKLDDSLGWQDYLKDIEIKVTP